MIVPCNILVILAGVATNGLTGVKGKALEDVTRRCEECGRNINKGSYSEVKNIWSYIIL